MIPLRLTLSPNSKKFLVSNLLVLFLDDCRCFLQLRGFSAGAPDPPHLHSPADVHVSESKWALGVDVSLYYFFLMGGIPGKRTLQDPGNFLRIYACA